MKLAHARDEVDGFQRYCQRPGAPAARPVWSGEQMRSWLLRPRVAGRAEPVEALCHGKALRHSAVLGHVLTSKGGEGLTRSVSQYGVVGRLAILYTLLLLSRSSGVVRPCRTSARGIR